MYAAHFWLNVPLYPPSMQYFDGSAGRDRAAHESLVVAMDRVIAFLEALPRESYEFLNARIFPPTGWCPRDTTTVVRTLFSQLRRIINPHDQLMIMDTADIANNAIVPTNLHAAGVPVDLEPSTLEDSSPADYEPSPQGSQYASTVAWEGSEDERLTEDHDPPPTKSDPHSPPRHPPAPPNQAPPRTSASPPPSTSDPAHEPPPPGTPQEITDLLHAVIRKGENHFQVPHHARFPPRRA